VNFGFEKFRPYLIGSHVPSSRGGQQTHWLWDLSRGVLPSTCRLTVVSAMTGEATWDGLDAPVVEADDW